MRGIEERPGGLVNGSAAARLVLLALLLAAPARADDAPAPTTEERLRRLEQELQELKARQTPAAAPVADKTKPLDEREPLFGEFDYSWMNGNNPQSSSLLGLGPINLVFYADSYYAFQFSQPIDHTIFQSTVAPRHNEISVNLLALGIEVANVGGPIGRFYIDYGSNVDTVAGQDRTGSRGFFLSNSIFRNIQQSAAGWHFHALHGVNLEAGIFPSYVGLESYLPQENWNYTKQFLSDFTPYYFAGLRLQLYLTQRQKLELWVVNGWQTFGQWHEARAGGYLYNWRPREWLSLVNSIYLGEDVQADPNAIRVWFDNNVQAQWYKGDGVHTLKSVATSFVLDFGFEHRTNDSSGVAGGAGLANRVQFTDLWASCLRLDIFYDSTQFLINPLPIGSPYSIPHGQFLGGGVTLTVDFTPSPWLIVRAEYSHRQTSIPYLSGHGGISGPNGVAPATPGAFTPDLQRADNRVILNATLRL
jgi:hypothetical protein